MVEVRQQQQLRRKSDKTDPLLAKRDAAGKPKKHSDARKNSCSEVGKRGFLSPET